MRGISVTQTLGNNLESELRGNCSANISELLGKYCRSIPLLTDYNEGEKSQNKMKSDSRVLVWHTDTKIKEYLVKMTRY